MVTSAVPGPTVVQEALYGTGIVVVVVVGSVVVVGWVVVVVVGLEGEVVSGEVVVVLGGTEVVVDDGIVLEVAGDVLGTALVVVLDDPAALGALPEETAAKLTPP